MNLALFDLDNTLLPIDSDHSWAQFLGRIGVVDGVEQDRRNDAFYRQYQAGTMNLDEFLAFQLAPLAQHSAQQLTAWHAQYMREVIQPKMLPVAFQLIAKHQDAGDLCAIVTATNEFVTAPIAKAFGIEHLIAIQLEMADGRYTGNYVGVPSYREGKIPRTHDWLASLNYQLADFEKSWFYSDSINDAPLLKIVTNPVATNPDDTLRKLAHERQWPIVELFQAENA